MLLSPEYDVVPTLHDIRDVVIKYCEFERNDEEHKHRAILYQTICNLTDITREGMEKALQEHHNRKVWLKPGTTVENGASSAWDLWIERPHGTRGWYMTIYLYRK